MSFKKKLSLFSIILSSLLFASISTYLFYYFGLLNKCFKGLPEFLQTPMSLISTSISIFILSFLLLYILYYIINNINVNIKKEAERTNNYLFQLPPINEYRIDEIYKKLQVLYIQEARFKGKKKEIPKSLLNNISVLENQINKLQERIKD